MNVKDLEFSDSVAAKILQRLPQVNSAAERELRATAAKKLGVIILDDYRQSRSVISLDKYRRNRTV